MKLSTIILLAFLFVLTLTAFALAQPGLPEPPEQTPLGGLEILAVLGGGYALKKLRDRKKT